MAGPCDLFEAGGTPCVAAFSTVRALFASYDGALYQVTRADNATQDVGVLSAGGVANAAAQDSFCSGSASCTISIIYDQSGKANHLRQAPKGTNNQTGAQDSLAVADALPITIGGQKAYGVHGPPHTGYRNDSTVGIATGDDPEVIYEVSDGTYNPQGCCFDFGNAETTNAAGGPGDMEALLFGKAYWDTGSGDGPWVLADMEVGVYNHGGATGTGRVSNYPGEPSMSYPFVMAMIKGNSATATNGGPFTVKGANAQSGTLATWYDAARPQGYSPMHKQGAIVLGIGGDDSNTGGGNFYEGVMTSGYSSNTTDDAVQANVVAAGYGK
jgi:non-reducing end alpha-L-arabinofuranosidase